MRVHHHARHDTGADGYVESLDEMMTTADVVSLHVPLTPETRHLIDARRLSLMKPGACLINVARAELVERTALIASLRSGHLGGFALDPPYGEPGRPDEELLAFENVVLTPHMAGWGPYLDDRRYQIMIDNCRAFLEGKPLRNVVDKASWF